MVVFESGSMNIIESNNRNNSPITLYFYFTNKCSVLRIKIYRSEDFQAIQKFLQNYNYTYTYISTNTFQKVTISLEIYSIN